MAEITNMISSSDVVTDGTRSPTIRVVGAGNDFRADLTMAGLKAISSSACVYHFSEIGTSSQIAAYAGTQVRDLSSLAVFGAEREAIFSDVAAAIIAGARVHGVVAWLTTGNPAILCGVTKTLLESATENSVEIELIGAPSTLDSVLLNCLPFDKASSWPGIQCYSASVLIANDIRPSRLAHCVILQTYYCRTSRQPLGFGLKKGALDLLLKHLLKSYAPDQTCCVLTIGRDEGIASTRQVFALAELGEQIHLITPWSTLFIQSALSSDFASKSLWSGSSVADMESFYQSPLEQLSSRLGAEKTYEDS